MAQPRLATEGQTPPGDRVSAAPLLSDSDGVGTRERVRAEAAGPSGSG